MLLVCANTYLVYQICGHTNQIATGSTSICHGAVLWCGPLLVLLLSVATFTVTCPLFLTVYHTYVSYWSESMFGLIAVMGCV